MNSALIMSLVSGGAVAISGGLFKIGQMLGTLNSTLEALSERVSRLETHLKSD